MRSLPPSIRITQRARARDRLGRWCADPGPDPSVSELLALAQPGAVLLTGGEPTLRADLPALLAALREAGSVPLLDTDGAALGAPRAWSALTAAGLAGVRLRVHALQPDAHDYLEGQQGALRRSLAALKMASEAGLPVEIETALSRPTAPSLPGLAVGLRGLGLRPARWLLRWPTLNDAQSPEAVAVQPRPGLLEPALLAAAEEAMSVGWDVILVGVPRCVAPGLGDERFAADRPLDAPAERCPGCPGTGCAGFTPAWVERFGRTELQSEGVGPTPAPPPLRAHAPADPPPPRGGRAPATRLRAVRSLARWASFDGDPSLSSPANPMPAVPRLALVGPARALRQRLVWLGQEQPQRVILGPIEPPDRPDAVELVREALRLGLPQVEVEADPAALAAAPDRALVGTRGLHAWTWPLSADAPLPDAAALDPLLRLHRLGGAQVGLARPSASPEPPLQAPLAWRRLDIDP